MNKSRLTTLFASLVLAIGLSAQTAAPDVSQTTLTFAQQSILASSTYQVAFLNADLQKRYDMAVTDYNANMQSGTSKVAPRIPVAPLAWQLAPADANGFVFYQYGPGVITSSIPLATVNLGTLKPPVSAPNTIDICAETSSKGWFQACDDDTVPSGLTVPGPNAGMYLKWGTPFRKQGIYQRVN
jgi:hypothetical protein